MKNERIIRRVSYGATVAFILIVTLIALNVKEVKAQPKATTEALPIACTTPEEAEKTVGDAFDTMLLSGKSGVSGFGTVVLFNRSTGHYLFLILTDDNRVCFVDMGRGASKVLQEFI